MSSAYKLLQLALVVFGAVALLLYPLALVWPLGWAWHPGALYESDYFMMIVGIYATLGVFLINAARNPAANLSLIWFAVWSSVVHAAIMAVSPSVTTTWGTCGEMSRRCFWWPSSCRCSWWRPVLSGLLPRRALPRAVAALSQGLSESDPHPSLRGPSHPPGRCTTERDHQGCGVHTDLMLDEVVGMS
jgi:uncharacterized protein DUF6632